MVTDKTPEFEYKQYPDHYYRYILGLNKPEVQKQLFDEGEDVALLVWSISTFKRGQLFYITQENRDADKRSEFSDIEDTNKWGFYALCCGYALTTYGDTVDSAMSQYYDNCDDDCY